MVRENEMSWLQMLEEASHCFWQVKREWDIMLGKYLNDENPKEKIQNIMNNNFDSLQNLIAHKQLINSLIGELN